MQRGKLEKTRKVWRSAGTGKPNISPDSRCLFVYPLHSLAMNCHDFVCHIATAAHLKILKLQKDETITHRIHAWYIYLHLPWTSTIHGGKYAIHGSYGKSPSLSRRFWILVPMDHMGHSLQLFLSPLMDPCSKIPSDQNRLKWIRCFSCRADRSQKVVILQVCGRPMFD